MSETEVKESEAIKKSVASPPGSPNALLARHGSSNSSDNGRRRRLSLDDRLNPGRMKKPPTPPMPLTPPLPPSSISGRRLSSSSGGQPPRYSRARTSSNAPREASYTEEEGDELDDDASSVESEVSYQSVISTPYQQDPAARSLSGGRGSAINLTHVYDELYKNEKRRETLREIIEFHQSRRKLKKLGAKYDSLLVQAASGISHPRQLQRASSSPMHSTQPLQAAKPEFLKKSLSLRRKASSKDLYGNPISPRLNTLERWSHSSLLNDATDDDELREDQVKSAPAISTRSGRSPAISVSSLSQGSGSAPTTSTSDILKGIRRRQKLFQGNRPDVRIIRLPRGGVTVNTRIGAIQVGMPPETIKDSMNMGLPIPTIFVIPQQRFHRWRMISVAEFEFPAYFNFFVLKRAVRLVTTKAAEVALRAAFQESLLGPVDLSMDSIADDFDPNLPLDFRPNINAERLFFGKNNIDALLNFVTLKEVRNKSYLEADLGDGIFVRLEANEGEDSYVIVDKKMNGEQEGASSPPSQPNSANTTPNASPSGGASSEDKKKIKHRRSVSDVQEFPSAPTRTLKRRGSALGPELHNNSDGEILARVPDTVELPNFRTFGLLDTRPEPFVPPPFGVTFLGTSHGFDPKSSTTGFVVWINGVGMLVDPPPNSGPMLELMGIPPRVIRNVLVTHCHADHDAGTMQKIMLDENVTVVTTPTIVNSFLRKYSALTDIPIADIKKRFIFRSARVGQWMDLFGGEIRVFYAFHTIPCVGFEVRFGGKSIVYSADTFYEPNKIRELCEQKILTERRAQALIDFPFDADLILHECGVPPIHTPLQSLMDLSEDIKSRLFLVHVTASTVPPDSGMRVAKEGVENTLVLDTSYSVPPLASAITVVGWMRDAAPLRDMRIEQLMDLLTVMRLHDFQTGEVVTDEVKNDSFLIIGSGAAAMFPPGKRIEASAPGTSIARAAMQADTSLLVQGDCVFVGGHQCTDPEDRPFIVATSMLRCAMFQTADVECFAREGNETYDLVMKWKSEASLRDKFSDIDVLDCLTLRQRALFTSLFTEHKFKKGEKLWTAGEPAKFVYVLTAGSFDLSFQSKYLEDDEPKPMDTEEPPEPMTPDLRKKMWERSNLISGSGLLLPPARKRGTYDAQQKKEAYQQFASLAHHLEEFSRGQKSKLLMCDLPALYHGLPVTSDLVVSSVYPKPKGYVASAANLLSFLRATPQLLFRMHAEFVSEHRRTNIEDEEEDED